MWSPGTGRYTPFSYLSIRYACSISHKDLQFLNNFDKFSATVGKSWEIFAIEKMLFLPLETFISVSLKNGFSFDQIYKTLLWQINTFLGDWFKFITSMPAKLQIQCVFCIVCTQQNYMFIKAMCSLFHPQLSHLFPAATSFCSMPSPYLGRIRTVKVQYS